MAHRMVFVAVMLAFGGSGSGQAPWRASNLQHFAKDIPREQLIQRMREFSFALGVRCSYCHDVPDTSTLDDPNFASDGKPAKARARVMLKMVDQLNGSMLAALPSRAEPRVEIACATCHRGLPLPKTLQTTLFEIVKRDGAAAAVARYRELRSTQAHPGRYNFGEWEINELARRLAEGGDRAAAVAILEMNGEFYPASASIDYQLGELHLAGDDRERALVHFRRALTKAPQHEAARRRIAELEKR